MRLKLVIAVGAMVVLLMGLFIAELRALSTYFRPKLSVKLYLIFPVICSQQSRACDKALSTSSELPTSNRESAGAVDEVWGLRRPDKKQLEQTGSNARLITVEKSRAGRDGSKLLMKLENDLTFSLADYVELDGDSASPASVVDRVLQRLRAAHPRSLSRADLAADPLCGGSVTAIRKALQRLVSRGLVEVNGTTESSGGAASLFQAVSASRDMSLNSCPTLGKSSGGLESGVGQPSEVSQPVPTLGEKDGTRWDSPTPCPTPKTSGDEGSARVGQVLEDSPKGDRTPEELAKLMEEAASTWD